MMGPRAAWALYAPPDHHTAPWVLFEFCSAHPGNRAGLHLPGPMTDHLLYGLTKETPTPGSSCFSRAFCYFSFFCSDASVGLASTVGSGSNGSDGGFVSWAPPTTPCKETKLEFLVIPFHKKSFKRELCIV